MGKAVPRNAPCPCGSGKKYKDCCMKKDLELIPAQKIQGVFTDIDGKKVERPIISLDSIPTHNKNGLSPSTTPEELMDLCIDEIYRILKAEKVGMLADLVNRVVLEMNIIPTFTYRGIGKRMEKDGRFAGSNLQIFSLAGTNPVELMLDRLSK